MTATSIVNADATAENVVVTVKAEHRDEPGEYYWLSITVIVLCIAVLLALVILAMTTPEP